MTLTKFRHGYSWRFRWNCKPVMWIRRIDTSLLTPRSPFLQCIGYLGIMGWDRMGWVWLIKSKLLDACGLSPCRVFGWVFLHGLEFKALNSPRMRPQNQSSLSQPKLCRRQSYRCRTPSIGIFGCAHHGWEDERTGRWLPYRTSTWFWVCPIGPLGHHPLRFPVVLSADPKSWLREMKSCVRCHTA